MFFGGLNDPSEKLRREQKREMEKRAAAAAAGSRMKAAMKTPPPSSSSSRSKNVVIEGDEEKTRRRKGKKKKFKALWKANLRCEIDDIAAKTAISDHHPDAREGVNAWREKRKPSFNQS